MNTENRDSGFDLVYADNSILVLNKPSGLVSVPGRTPELQDSLSRRVQSVYPDACIVHRLDMDTSGILIMARSSDAQRELGRMFMNRNIGKTYIAIVQGTVPRESGDIEFPLRPDWPNRPRQQVDFECGKPSLTRYKILEVDAETCTSRLEIEPVTGRTHQIRIHLSTFGHPILGDRLYAPLDVRSRSCRLLLHAQSLHLQHPVTGVRMQFECTAPF